MSTDFFCTSAVSRSRHRVSREPACDIRLSARRHFGENCPACNLFRVPGQMLDAEEQDQDWQGWMVKPPFSSSATPEKSFIQPKYLFSTRKGSSCSASPSVLAPEKVPPVLTWLCSQHLKGSSVLIPSVSEHLKGSSWFHLPSVSAPEGFLLF
ncbi:hypothetical protein AVEN_145995-1 [Araneus ventricosus]|uniref:Uncharacterized protein n=1 Tax=Araneus ventricosus TaxID=182803 RepID=A0A4Y2LJP6_ARAVE|nr:hypothetical protein AVEN_145995-1 [Araneus ventricosus]